MLTLPAAMPVTTALEVIVAVVALLLLHVPPLVALLNVVVLPTHTSLFPVVAEAAEVTVIVAVLTQPATLV